MSKQCKCRVTAIHVASEAETRKQHGEILEDRGKICLHKVS